VTTTPITPARHRAPTTDPRRSPAGRRQAPGAALWQASPLTYLALIIASVLSIFPIVWTVIVASRDNSSIYEIPPPLWLGGNLFSNISRAFNNEQAAFTYGLVNSVLVSAVVTFSVVFFSTLAGFAFAKLRFRGRGGLLLFIILTMMVPTQLGYIPLYILMVKLGWQGQLQAVILPFLVTGFGVFMMRQYAAAAVSDELIEAARVDGCSTWRIYWNVVLPAVRPAAAVLGLLTFMQTWNEFLWPYIVLTPDTPTVQYSLKILASGYYSTDYAQVFAGTAVATIPLLVVFLIFGKQIIGGIMEGSVKA
jgi:cellobiose transport system permease protein